MKVDPRPVMLIGVQDDQHIIDIFRGLIGDFEPLARRIAEGDVVVYDMGTRPEMGDALDHVNEVSAIVAHHLYYDGQETRPFFYNRNNNDLPELAREAGIPLFTFGDYPMRTRIRAKKLSSGLRYYAP